jgi:hypothetical protein
MYTGFVCGNLRETEHLEDLGVDGSISTCDSKKSHWRVYQSDLAQEWDKWWDLV